MLQYIQHYYHLKDVELIDFHVMQCVADDMSIYKVTYLNAKEVSTFS